VNNVVIYQNDHLGTPQKLTAVNGAVVWSAKYSSFGEADVDPSSTITNNLRFPGQYFDEETGLHYNYFRYYEPKVGRYLRRDPIGLLGGENLYLYVTNNPGSFSDPKGLQRGSRAGSQYAYSGKPSKVDFLEVIYSFLNFFNAINQTNKVVEDINILSSTIECNKKEIASICFNPGPPPQGAYVTLGGSITSGDARKLKCVTITIVGQKDCYKCTDEYKKTVEEQKELDRKGEYLAQELIYKQLRKEMEQKRLEQNAN